MKNVPQYPLPPNLPTAPFVRVDDSTIVTVDGNEAVRSEDNGHSWARSPLFPGADGSPDYPNLKLKLDSMALLRTAAGTLIASTQDLSRMQWSWDKQLRDAPGAVLPNMVLRSCDGGRTWQDLQELHSEWTGAVRDIVQTRDGRIVFTSMRMLHNPGRHVSLTYSSDDEGVTWKPSNLIDLGGIGHHDGATEPTLCELGDGRLWMLVRTSFDQFWSVISEDGGRYWRHWSPSGINASSAPAILQRLASGRLLLLWNRAEAGHELRYPEYDGCEFQINNYRDELQAALSDDDGKTWTKPKVIMRIGDYNADEVSYPYVFEHSPGVLWITAMRKPVNHTCIHEDDLL